MTSVGATLGVTVDTRIAAACSSCFNAFSGLTKGVYVVSLVGFQINIGAPNRLTRRVNVVRKGYISHCTVPYEAIVGRNIIRRGEIE